MKFNPMSNQPNSLGKSVKETKRELRLFFESKIKENERRIGFLNQKRLECLKDKSELRNFFLPIWLDGLKERKEDRVRWEEIVKWTKKRVKKLSTS